jgi:hypothetical protein
MSENFEIYHNKQEITENESTKLSNKERETFQKDFMKEMEEYANISALIEAAGTDTPDTQKSSSIDSDPAKFENRNDMKHSYLNNAKQLAKDHQARLGIINSDPTGKAQKASGENF